MLGEGEEQNCEQMLKFFWTCDVGGGNKDEKILNVPGAKVHPL